MIQQKIEIDVGSQKKTHAVGQNERYALALRICYGSQIAVD